MCVYDEVADVVAKGPTRSTVVLKAGIQVDLRVVPEESYGAALHYFTGSKAHNIAVRKRGQAKGLKINEYGVFRGPERIAGRSEEEIFASVGLPFIEPELREDRGEIEAAVAGKLPKLVRLAGNPRRPSRPYERVRRSRTPCARWRMLQGQLATNTSP